MLVIVILAVLGGAVVPRFTGSLERARLQEAAFACGYLAASGARMAVADGRVVKLVLDSEARSVALECDAETDADDVPAPLELSEGIRIESVDVIGRPGYEQDVEEDAVRFFPDGRADEGYVVLATETGGKFTVFVNPVTGFTRVTVGEMQQDDWSELETIRESRSLLEQ